MDVTYRCGWCREHGAPDSAARRSSSPAARARPIGFRFIRRTDRGVEQLAMEPLGVLRGRWTVRLWCEGCGHSITPMKASALRRLYQQALRSDARDVYVA